MDQKSFIVGGLTALLLTAAVVPVSAKIGTVTKELEYRDIQVSLDGETLDLKDAKGNPVEPFMFDGTNYLPVRALAEALGLDVAWDGSTATVVLTTPNETEGTEQSDAQEEKQLFSREQIRVYFCGLIEDENGNKAAKLRIKNDSDYDIGIYARDTTVQGVSVDVSGGITYVNSDESAEWLLSITPESLRSGNISSYQTIKTRFRCRGEDYAGNQIDFETGAFLLS